MTWVILSKSIPLAATSVAIKKAGEHPRRKASTVFQTFLLFHIPMKHSPENPVSPQLFETVRLPFPRSAENNTTFRVLIHQNMQKRMVFILPSARYAFCSILPFSSILHINQVISRINSSTSSWISGLRVAENRDILHPLPGMRAQISFTSSSNPYPASDPLNSRRMSHFILYQKLQTILRTRSMTRPGFHDDMGFSATAASVSVCQQNPPNTAEPSTFFLSYMKNLS